MKQFKDLKIGEKVAFIDTLYEMEVIGIERVEPEYDGQPLIKIKTGNTSYGEETVYANYIVDERHYFENTSNSLIAPQETAEILHNIYCEGIKTGKKYLANSIKQLLMIK